MAKTSTKYTPERKDAIRQLLEAGMPRSQVAPAVGIGVSTLYDWIAEHEEFKDLVEKAEARAVLDALVSIKSAFGHDWRSAAWYLARRGGPEFIEQQKIDHTTNGKEIVTFTLDFGRVLSEEESQESTE